MKKTTTITTTEAEFVLTLLHTATNMHLHHLMTDSFAEHEALDGYYKEFPLLVDNLVETYQGSHGVIKSYPKLYQSATNCVKELEEICEFIEENRGCFGEDSSIQNIIDEIWAFVDKTLYKLKQLK